MLLRAEMGDGTLSRHKTLDSTQSQRWQMLLLAGLDTALRQYTYYVVHSRDEKRYCHMFHDCLSYSCTSELKMKMSDISQKQGSVNRLP